MNVCTEESQSIWINDSLWDSRRGKKCWEKSLMDDEQESRVFAHSEGGW